jgi:hypothetical protein
VDVGEIFFLWLRSYHRKSKNSHKIKILPVLRCLLLAPDFPRQRGADAMWSTLFAITFVIAVALSFAAIVMDTIKGGSL